MMVLGILLKIVKLVPMCIAEKMDAPLMAHEAGAGVG